MAVRITKSAVNFREKLAELERPIGVNGAALMATSTPQDAFSLIGARNRNRIINGAMVLDQRNSGASVNGTAGVYPVDRFEIEHFLGGGTGTGQQSSTAPTGFTNSLLITVTGTDTSLASTDFYTVRQIIEGYNISDLSFGTSNPSTVTISFWVRSSVTGIYCFSLSNGGNNRGYATEYTINVANTWEKKTITIPGCTDGTWGTTNGRGIQCRWCMGTGTSRQATVNTWAASEVHGTSNQTNLFATNGATFYLTGVQLEEGKVATPFEYRNYGQELTLCQRYYEVGNQSCWSGMTTTNVTYARVMVDYKVEKRAVPSTLTVTTVDYGGGFNSSNPTTTTSSTRGFQWYKLATSGSNDSWNFITWAANSEL